MFVTGKPFEPDVTKHSSLFCLIVLWIRYQLSISSICHFKVKYYHRGVLKSASSVLTNIRLGCQRWHISKAKVEGSSLAFNDTTGCHCNKTFSGVIYATVSIFIQAFDWVYTDSLMYIMPKKFYNMGHRCQCFITFSSVVYSTINKFPHNFDWGCANSGINCSKLYQNSFATLATDVNVIQRFSGIIYSTVSKLPQDFDCGYADSGIIKPKKS